MNLSAVKAEALAQVDQLRRERDEAEALAATLYEAVKGYYHHCICPQREMEAVNLAARRAIYAYEKARRP